MYKRQRRREAFWLEVGHAFVIGAAMVGVAVVALHFVGRGEAWDGIVLVGWVAIYLTVQRRSTKQHIELRQVEQDAYMRGLNARDAEG